MRPGVGTTRVLTVCNKGDMGFWHSPIYSMINNADREGVIRYPQGSSGEKYPLLQLEHFYKGFILGPVGRIT